MALSDFFGENIFGVEYKHDFINTKELVIDKIIRENSMEPDKFIMFSNNTDDINICKKHGGLSVSIISDKEKQNTKRECFELSGVNMFINDYKAITT
ncbi:MAG: hypothetical protein IKT70_08640 [Clostridia bacterium]|nr:hypothetical protein [Clostridia bacterium]